MKNLDYIPRPSRKVSMYAAIIDLGHILRMFHTR